ncbi:MAG: SMP-30/gluconolactonase/LRE family protein [Methylocystis sp.]|uniref:SMP-30/gluconolactonase/LRE family protein n=1 Tax=Methylocystis sp. TaxID=1911079 RepID=UPI003D14B390
MSESTNVSEEAGFVAWADAFHGVIGARFQRLLLAETNAHEGPVYVAADHALYFTTTPEAGFKNVHVRRVRLSGDAFPFRSGAIETVLENANMANGMTLGSDGRLVVCEQGTRETPARISRFDPRSGAIETIVDHWRGLRFNSPNDVAIASDGAIWFTDPDYGQLQGFKGPAEIGAYVYRHDPVSGETSVVADDFNKPNGLAFSPDRSALYVTDSGADQASGALVPSLPHHIRAFDVAGGRRLCNSRLFAVVSPGIPDGIKCDAHGRVYVSSATGVQAFSAEGELLGEIMAPGVANFTFGGPNNDVLFILADTRIWQAALTVAGAV